MAQTHDKLVVSASPHRVTTTDTTKIMGMVLLAIFPALAVGVYQFGFRAALLVATCIISSVAFEALYNVITKRPQTIGDLSAVLTGAILAFLLPAGLPLWIGVIGSFFAIIVVKQIFGGLGKNIMNPAITARAFLLISFATDITKYPLANSRQAKNQAADAISTATPLDELFHGTLDTVTASNADLLLGNIGGSIGEISAIALVLGAAFLLYKRVITWHAPVAFIGTLFVLGFAWGGLHGAIFHILAGGALFGAIFCATDYTTTPTMPLGKIIFGVGAGAITMLIRLFASYPEGILFGILLMNIVTPYIDRFTEYLYVRKYAKKLAPKEAK